MTFWKKLPTVGQGQVAFTFTIRVVAWIQTMEQSQLLLADLQNFGKEKLKRFCKTRNTAFVSKIQSNDLPKHEIYLRYLWICMYVINRVQNNRNTLRWSYARWKYPAAEKMKHSAISSWNTCLLVGSAIRKECGELVCQLTSNTYNGKVLCHQRSPILDSVVMGTRKPAGHDALNSWLLFDDKRF